MGLDTTHNAFHGPYSQFGRLRTFIADQIGIPLDLMEGFYSDAEYGGLFSFLKYDYKQGDEIGVAHLRRLIKRFPLKWSAFRPDPLHTLLNHSDCDGYINWADCKKIAKRLREIAENLEDDSIPEMPERGVYDGYKKAIIRFAEGCELAAERKEKLHFR